MFVVIKFASIFLATTALGSCLINSVCHMWTAELASKHIIHSTLVWMSGDERVVTKE